MLSNYSALLNNWSFIYPSKWIPICITRSVVLISAEIDMFCSYHKRVGNCEQASTSQRKPTRQRQQLLCDDSNSPNELGNEVCDIIKCVAIWYEKGASGNAFLRKEKFRAKAS